MVGYVAQGVQKRINERDSHAEWRFLSSVSQTIGGDLREKIHSKDNKDGKILQVSPDKAKTMAQPIRCLTPGDTRRNNRLERKSFHSQVRFRSAMTMGDIDIYLVSPPPSAILSVICLFFQVMRLTAVPHSDDSNGFYDIMLQYKQQLRLHHVPTMSRHS